MFKKIEDERLKLENLKNIRIIAIVQTLLLTGLWVYEAFIQGQGTSGTPLTFILLITGILSGLLSMRVSIANENKPPKAKSIFNSYPVGFTISLSIGIIMGLFIQLVTPDYPIRDTIIIATVFFLCFLGAYTFGYFAKKKHDEDADDDE